MTINADNAIYFRRRRKICLPPGEAEEPLPVNYIASVIRNLEPLGFTFSEDLIGECRRLSVDQLITLYEELIPVLQKSRGAHQEFRPMYPDFPSQVMEMSRSELYINAVLHYVTWGRYLPAQERQERIPLLDNVELTVIDLGTDEEFKGLFTQIAASNTSLSEQDREDLDWFIRTFREGIAPLLPGRIPQKETMAGICGLLIRHTANGMEMAGRYCRTATDVLRIAVSTLR